MLLLPPPRPLASPPGQYRRDLLPYMTQGRIQFLRAHDLLLAQMLINMGNNATNHVIGISWASRLVPLSLLCNDLLFICWPRKISWKRWQNLRVRHPSVPYHIAIPHPPCILSSRLTPIGLLKCVSAVVKECLHNLRRSQLYNIRQMSRDDLNVSVLPQNSLRQVSVHPNNTAYNPTWIPENLLETLDLPVLFVRPPSHVIKLQMIKQWPIRYPSLCPFCNIHFAATR